MKKIGALALICFIVLLILSLFSGFNDLTTRAAKQNIIISVSPQGEINTKAVIVNVATSEKAKCMYNLGEKSAVAFKYYTTMSVTGEYRHTHLLKDLKNGNYELSIKCTDEEGFSHVSNVNLDVKLSSECIRYCEYVDDCDEYASDGCGLVCKRETDGINCGEGKVCKDSFCIKKEEPVKKEEMVVITEEPVVIEKSSGILNKILSFLRGIFK